MASSSIPKVTRRQAVRAAGKALAGAATLDAMASLSAAASSFTNLAEARRPDVQDREKADQTLRIATCQFPVSGSAAENATYIREFMNRAAAQGAHMLHTPEASLSGYPGCDLPSFDHYDWEALRRETVGLRALARQLKIWLALGSSHYLEANIKPTDCVYLIDPEGKIVDRYDKCFCTEEDQIHYSAGDRLVAHEVRGVKVGLAICYDICWPQLYIAYRKLGVTVMVHSYSNARDKGENCLDLLNTRQVATRCADNHMWAICNNSSAPYSHWGSFVARPDATVPKQLEKDVPGMLVHDYPDTLSPGGWYHCRQPMEMAENTIMWWGTPSHSPRQSNGQSEP